MSILKVDTIQTTSGAGLYPARAWVNFDGTGEVSIRNGGNVTNIRDNSIGNYTVDLTTAMQDANYAVASAGHATTTTASAGRVIEPYNFTPSSVRIVTASSGNGAVADNAIVNITILR
jgi:hypothetical protein